MSESDLHYEPRIVGGTGKEKKANEDIQSLVDQLAQNIKQQTGKNYPHLRAVSYKSQVVAGTNYFVKIDAGHEHIHARIFRPLPCHGNTIELHGLVSNKTKEEPIEYF